MPGSGFLCQFRTACCHISHIPLCHNLFCPQKGRAADVCSATRPFVLPVPPAPALRGRGGHNKTTVRAHRGFAFKCQRLVVTIREIPLKLPGCPGHTLLQTQRGLSAEQLSLLVIGRIRGPARRYSFQRFLPVQKVAPYYSATLKKDAWNFWFLYLFILFQSTFRRKRQV